MGSSSTKAQSGDLFLPMVLRMEFCGAKTIDRYTEIMKRLKSAVVVDTGSNHGKNNVHYRYTHADVKDFPFPENCRQMELWDEFQVKDESVNDPCSYIELLWKMVRALVKAEVDQPAAWLTTLGNTSDGMAKVTEPCPPLSILGLSFGTWLRTGQFANIQQYGHNGASEIGTFCMKPDGGIAVYIVLHIQGRRHVFCMEIFASTICDPLVLSENDNGHREIYLRLKRPPLISLLADERSINISVSDIARDPERLHWHRYPEITKGSRRAIGKCDVINVIFADDANLIPLSDRLVSSTREVHFMCVNQQDEELTRSKQIETTIRNLLKSHEQDSWTICYAFQVLQSRGLKMEVKLTEKFVRTLTEVATRNVTVFEKTIGGLIQYADSGKELHLLDLGNVDMEKLQGVGSITDRRRKVDGNRPVICNAVVTPMRILFELPKPDNNRIIRMYDPDSILRLSFRDEDNGQLSNLNYSKEVCSDDSELLAFTVAERLRGITVYGRHFEYLGGSKSLTKAHGCYMYAKDPRGFTAQIIRDSIGDLSHIRCPATYLCRLGLAFTSSDLSFRVNGREKIPDIEENGYCFSDGIGKISGKLATKVSTTHALL